MAEKIIVGPVNQGFRNNREPFVIDNDNFPILINAYRGADASKENAARQILRASPDFSIQHLQPIIHQEQRLH